MLPSSSINGTVNSPFNRFTAEEGGIKTSTVNDKISNYISDPAAKSNVFAGFSPHSQINQPHVREEQLEPPTIFPPYQGLQLQLQGFLDQDRAYLMERFDELNYGKNSAKQSFLKLSKFSNDPQAIKSAFQSFQIILGEEFFVQNLIKQCDYFQRKLLPRLSKDMCESIYQQILLLKQQITQYKIQLTHQLLQEMQVEHQLLLDEKFSLQQLLGNNPKFSFSNGLMPSGKTRIEDQNVLVNMKPKNQFNATSSKPQCEVLQDRFPHLSEKQFMEGLPNTNVTPVDANGDSLLHLAVLIGNDNLCRAILNKSACINHWNKQGNTALHLAFKEKKWEIIKTLIEFGAEMAIRNQQGKTPDLMTENMPNELRELIK